MGDRRPLGDDAEVHETIGRRGGAQKTRVEVLSAGNRAVIVKDCDFSVVAQIGGDLRLNGEYWHEHGDMSASSAYFVARGAGLVPAAERIEQ